MIQKRLKERRRHGDFSRHLARVVQAGRTEVGTRQGWLKKSRTRSFSAQIDVPPSRLLDAILKSPAFFERLVLDVLVKMGYSRPQVPQLFDLFWKVSAS